MTNTKVLATVGGKPITDADIDAFIAGLGQRGAQYQNPQGRAMILEQLISDRLFLIDASRNLMEADPRFKAELARAKESLLISFAIDKVISGVRDVTDAEAETYYKSNPDKFAAGEEISASHILVDDETQAASILADIKAGTVTFEDAAKQHSKCPSAQNGGSLGTFGRGQMVPEFENACFALNKGDITGPVKTEFGYHIIRLDDKKESGTVSFKESLPEIKEMLLKEKQKAAYQSKINQMKILYPVDKF